MDEWTHLTSGEATHRQREQRALRQVTSVQPQSRNRRRIRIILANALVALAARLAPATPAPSRGHSDSLANAQS